MILTFLPTMKLPRISARDDAAHNLLHRLTQYSNRRNVIVLAIASDSAAVAAAIASELKINFDILQVGEITAPGSGGHAIGAITGDGFRILNHELIDRLQLSDADVSDAILKASTNMAQREPFHYGRHPTLALEDQTVLLVDDGTTLGSTLRAAIRLLRRQHVQRIIVVLPTASRKVACDLSLDADELVTLAEPATAIGTGNWFKPCSLSSTAAVHRL
jgi:predicted phosphoribosyltransferase